MTGAARKSLRTSRADREVIRITDLFPAGVRRSELPSGSHPAFPACGYLFLNLGDPFCRIQSRESEGGGIIHPSECFPPWSLLLAYEEDTGLRRIRGYDVAFKRIDPGQLLRSVYSASSYSLGRLPYKPRFSSSPQSPAEGQTSSGLERLLLVFQRNPRTLSCSSLSGLAVI